MMMKNYKIRTILELLKEEVENGEISLREAAVDAEAVGNTPLYNPYTGIEIIDETE